MVEPNENLLPMREMNRVILPFFLLQFVVSPSFKAQRDSWGPWITICDASQSQPDPIYLDELLAPLKRGGGESKVSIIIYNKSREYSESQSLYNVLPYFDSDVFVPFLMQYNGDGQNLIFASKSGGKSLALDEVIRSRAYVVTSDDLWVDYFENNQSNLSLERNNDLPLEIAGEGFVAFSILRSSAVRKSENATWFTYESEFWHRINKLVTNVHTEHARRVAEKSDAADLESRTYPTSVLALNVRSAMGVQARGATNWSSGESTAFTNWSQEVMMLLSITEFDNLGLKPLKVANGRLEPQIGLSFLQKSTELQSDWSDMEGIDITAAQEVFSKGEQVRATNRNVRETMTIGSIQALAIPLGAVWRKRGSSNVGGRIVLSPGLVRANASTRLVEGEFDYFLTSSLAPGETLTGISGLGLTQRNRASDYDPYQEYLRGTSMSYNVDALIFQGSNIWTVGGYFSTLSMDMMEGENHLPSAQAGAFTSTWAGQTIQLSEWGLRLGLSFSAGKQ